MQDVLETPGLAGSVVRFSVDQYHRLCDAGIVSERTELLEGVVIEKMGKSPLHTWTVGLLADWFRTHLKSTSHVRVEQPLTLTRSEPEPDLAVVCGRPDFFREQHPQSAALVVEVAITTVDLDRAKIAMYAAAGIPEYWLVLPEQQKLLVHSDPVGDGYRTVRTLSPEDSMTTSVCDAALDLSTVFGP